MSVVNLSWCGVVLIGPVPGWLQVTGGSYWKKSEMQTGGLSTPESHTPEACQELPFAVIFHDIVLTRYNAA